MLTSDSLRRRASELGFDLCGVAPVDNFPELRFLRQWIDRGYAGEMTWLERSADRRTDIRAVLPAARSVVVTGTVYNTRSSEQEPDVDRARIARYAWGDDYHDVLKARMEELLAWMRREAAEPFDARVYVDTGPVQERVFAQYAGLGWIGKNSCLINAELGSWLFLAEIICTLPIAPDTQGLEQCGSCTRCLDACPTGALLEAGVLDATRCLSYLTIELRGAIPEEHRAALGSHVYGCDICQQVCPYNQPAVRSSDPVWQPRAALETPKLLDLWRLSDDELRKTVKGTAMTRAKLTGLRRNLAVAIGNGEDPEAIAALAEEDEGRPSATDGMVVEHIQWAVTRSTI